MFNTEHHQNENASTKNHLPPKGWLQGDSKLEMQVSTGSQGVIPGNIHARPMECCWKYCEGREGSLKPKRLRESMKLD